MWGGPDQEAVSGGLMTHLHPLWLMRRNTHRLQQSCSGAPRVTSAEQKRTSRVHEQHWHYHVHYYFQFKDKIWPWLVKSLEWLRLFNAFESRLFCSSRLCLVDQKQSKYVSLEHRRSHKQHRYIYRNNQQYIVWLKIILFSFMPKIIRY